MDSEETSLLSSEIKEIPYSSLHLEREIGRGAFGCVYRATVTAISNGVSGHSTRSSSNSRPVPGTVVAVKTLRDQVSDSERDEFEHEIKIMQACGHHVNIVRCLGFCRAPRLCIVMEHVPCGDLLSYLRGVRNMYQQRKRTVSGSSASYITPNTPNGIGMHINFESAPSTPTTPTTPKSKCKDTTILFFKGVWSRPFR